VQEVNSVAKTETLPNDVLDVIAQKLGSRLPRVVTANVLGGGAPAGAPPSLQETFALWMLEASDVIAPTSDLTRLVKNLGVWHHQIAAAGNPVAFARSRPLGADAASWSIREVSNSMLASAIDDTITWIDANIPDPLTVRLVTIPAYSVYVFLLYDEADTSKQKVVVISAPAGTRTLTTHKVYSSQEFLDALRATQHIRGLS
jgi:hypothetical protein